MVLKDNICKHDQGTMLVVEEVLLTIEIVTEVCEKCGNKLMKFQD
jgi:hypothetical protein